LRKIDSYDELYFVSKKNLKVEYLFVNIKIMNTEIAKVKKVNLEKWFCFLDNGTFCHISKFNNKDDMQEWISIEYEYENSDKWKQVKKIIKIINIMNEIYWNNTDYSTNNPDLFEKIPKDIVKLLKWWNLTTTKLRQYYEIVVNLYNAYLKKKEFNENELKTDINILLAKINYDINRQGYKVPQEMYDFVKYHRNKIFKNEDKDKVLDRFKIFRKHFETVVAYSV